MLAGRLTEALDLIKPENIKVKSMPRSKKQLCAALLDVGKRFVRVEVSDQYMPSYSSGDDASSTSADEDEEDEEKDWQLKEAVRVARKQVEGPTFTVTCADLCPECSAISFFNVRRSPPRSSKGPR